MPVTRFRPSDLARRHGLSAQAVRNYEADGFLPVAERTASGYRIYTDVHAAALDAFLALVRAHGHATAGRVMTALHDGRVDDALAAIDRGHALLQRDRETLHAVRRAAGELTAAPPAVRATAPGVAGGPRTAVAGGPLSVGEVARRLGITAATVRSWEAAGILRPARDPATGHRVYGADDVRDAELTHLLRRGGHPLADIATVVEQVRTAGGTTALADALEGWSRTLTARGRAMLTAAGQLDRYLDLAP